MKPKNLETERLEYLKTVLQNVAPERLDMRNWVVNPHVPFCNTAGCAAGHACHDPYFASLGLSLSEDNSMEPHFGEAYGYSALMRFFGLTQREANFLFNPDTYSGTTGKLKVISRINYLLERKGI